MLDLTGCIRRGLGRRGRALITAMAATLLLAACDSAEERVQSHHARGLELVAAGQADKALLEFTNAVRIDDAFAPAHLELGRLHREAGRLSRAAAHLRRAVELGPEDLEARLTLGHTLLDLGDVEAATAEAGKVLALEPERPAALALAAATDLVAGRGDRAVRRARAALKADPALDLARLVLVAERVRAGDHDSALSLIDAAPERPGEAASPLDLLRLQVLETAGDRERLGAALDDLVAAHPDEARFRLARVAWRLRGETPDLDGAEADLRAAAELTPDDPAARMRVVEFLGEARGPDAARAELERLIAASEDVAERAELDRSLALLEARSGDREAALARLEAAAARDDAPDEADAAKLLLARMLAEDSPRRAALVAEVLERDPTNADALTLRGAAALREGRVEAAVDDLQAALAEAPRRPMLLEALAEAHERAGDPALAAERRALAVQASDSAPGPSLRHAAALAAEGRHASAESVILDALRRSPRHPRLLAALAEVRLAQEDWAGAEQAAAALEAAIEADGERGRLADWASGLRAAAMLGQGRGEETVSMLEAGWDARGRFEDMAALVGGYLRAGKTARARAFVEARLAETPEDARVHLLAANVATADGDTAAVEAALRRAVAAAPKDAGMHARLVSHLEAEGRGEAAAEAIAAGLAAAPADRRLLFAKAVRAERAGDSEAAIAVYEGLLETEPGSRIFANNLASLLSDHRDDPESLTRAAELARRLRGAADPSFRDTYGWTLHRIGESAEAAAVLRTTAPEMPESAVAQYHLGMAWAAVGRNEAATEQLRRALDLAADGAPLPPRALAEAEATLAELAAAETEAADDAPEPDG